MSKQYPGCGNGGEGSGHWQQLAPTCFMAPQVPFVPSQTSREGWSVPLRRRHAASASAGSASKQAPTAWQQRDDTAGNVVVVVAVPGAVVVVVSPGSVAVLPATHVQSTQCCPAPQPVAPSHSSPSPGSTSPSPHPVESGASLNGRLNFLATSVPESNRQPGRMRALSCDLPFKPGHADAGHTACTRVPPGVDKPQLFNLYSGGAIYPNGLNGIDAASDLLFGKQPIEIPVRA